MRLGFRLPPHIGIGDAVIFTSLPENYYKTTGEKLVDYSHHWVFDHNPYVDRGGGATEIVDLWKLFLDTPNRSGKSKFHCSAEIISEILYTMTLASRPNLYYPEKTPHLENLTLLHLKGISQTVLAPHVTDYLCRKYPKAVQIGLPTEWVKGFHFYAPQGVWDLAGQLSRCSRLICVDSGPSWVASCFPHIRIDKIRSNDVKQCTHVPLERKNPVSYFDDATLFNFYNTTGESIGFTESYLGI